MSALCVTCLALTGPTPAAADPGGDVKTAAKAVDRAEAILEDATALARNTARRLEATKAALPRAQVEVAVSRGLVAAARAEANTARRQATVAREQYAGVAQSFLHAQGIVATARKRVDGIAAASYMGSSFARINFLAAATGPQDVMDRLGLIDQVMQKQKADVAMMIIARRAARTEQDKAGLAERAAEDAEQAARDKLVAAQSAQTAAERARATVVRLTASRAKALSIANSQRRVVLAKYQAAKANEARIEDALRAYNQRHGGSATGPYLGGQLLMPVHGWKSSDFGERYDPYYGVWQLHAGTDFAAGGGTPIHAAAGGWVIQAGWNGGYGNYTCINHGRFAGHGFATCYGHQSAILVHVGEYVTRGEVIGRVGTTGASTGYHLHFETRFDGVPRNPLPYLPPCLC